MQPKLDQRVIHISDWDRSNSFYRDVLGAELVDRGGGTRAYRFRDAQLNVHRPGVAPHPVARIPVAPGNSDRCAAERRQIEQRAASTTAKAGQLLIGDECVVDGRARQRRPSAG